MAALSREQLEDWVERWLQVNRDADTDIDAHTHTGAHADDHAN